MMSLQQVTTQRVQHRASQSLAAACCLRQYADGIPDDLFLTSFRISISLQCISPDFESFSVLESGGKAEATLPSVMRPTIRCFTLGT